MMNFNYDLPRERLFPTILKFTISISPTCKAMLKVKNKTIELMCWMSPHSEEAIRKYSKKVFLKISQYSQENTCAGISF